jgi:PAS domain S-box-containing protein
MNSVPSFELNGRTYSLPDGAQILDSIFAMVGVLSPDGVLLSANRPPLERAGLRPEQVIGLKVWETHWFNYDPTVSQRVRAAVIKAAAGETDRFDLRVCMAGGELMDIDFMLVPLRDESGRITHLIPSAVDVGDRVRARRDAESSDRRYRQIVDSAHEGIWLIDTQGVTLFLNQRMATMLNTHPQHVIGRSAFDFIYPEDMKDGRDELARRLASSGGDQFEFRYRRADGSPLHARVSSSPVMDDDGAVAAILGLFTDVTESQLYEQALRDSRERLELAQVAAGLGVFDWEVTSGKVVWTQEQERVFGMEPGTFEGSYEGWAKRTFKTDVDRLVPLFQAWMASRRAEVHFEFRIKRPDGQTRWIEARGKYVYDDQGNCLRMIGTNMDVTTAKQAQEQLHLLNQTLERRVFERTEQLRALASQLARVEGDERRRIAAVLHDDLQQILVAARMKLGTAVSALAAGESVEQRLARADDLLKEAIAASRSLAVDLSPPVLQDTDLPTALRWLARQFQQRHGLLVDVQTTGTTDVPSVERRTILFNAIRELLMNVVKHAGVHKATLTASQSDRIIRIVVQDQGKGFDANVPLINRLTDHFGLFNVRERLEWMGGRMLLRTKPGHGSRVEIQMPVVDSAAVLASLSDDETHAPAPAPTDPSSSNQAIQSASGRKRIIVADDHVIMRQGLLALLNQHPQVQVDAQASDGRQVVDLALKLKPDVVIMDVTLPLLSGIQATRIIAKALPATRIIGLSMHERSDMQQPMLDAGACAYLCKDGPVSELIDAIFRGPGSANGGHAGM